jgi:predicted ATPase
MTGFRHINVSGFRRLKDVQLAMNPLNVLIGANGSGKTSLMDVVSLLADSARGQLKQAISDLGGLDASLTNLKSMESKKVKKLVVDVQIENEKLDELRYAIELVPEGIGYGIFQEVLNNAASMPLLSKRYIPSSAQSRSSEGSHETVLSRSSRKLKVRADVQRLLSSVTQYQVLDVSNRSPIRLPQQLREANTPGNDGETLVACLYGIREADPDLFELIEDTLRAGFPEFERLSFPAVAAGMMTMTWKDKPSTLPFYLNQLSEGTLRFLWLVTLLYSPGLSAITMIDEPEVSLHPELLSLIAELFREASKRTQLIVATHSDRLVRFLKPEEVVTVSLDETGAALFKRANEFDLDQWLEDYSLDQVWSMGRIGGRS